MPPPEAISHAPVSYITHLVPHFNTLTGTYFSSAGLCKKDKGVGGGGGYPIQCIVSSNSPEYNIEMNIKPYLNS